MKASLVALKELSLGLLLTIVATAAVIVKLAAGTIVIVMKEIETSTLARLEQPSS